MEEGGKKIIPHIWEISAGVDRTMFAILDCSLREGKEGWYFALPSLIAPYQCAIFPLVNKDGMPELSAEIEKSLRNEWLDVFFDDSGSIGRRYARADEVGIPFCLTVDGDSVKNRDVTLRERDSGKQIRVNVTNLGGILRKLIFGEISFDKAGMSVKAGGK